MAKKKEVSNATTNRASSVDAAISSLKKKFSATVIDWMSEVPEDRREIISTGSLSLDSALGIGGVVQGRMYEIYGQAGGGKSTAALSILKQAKKRNIKALYIDAEHALDKSLVTNLGASPEDIILARGFSGEENLDIAEALIATGEIGVCVIDSVTALVPLAEMEQESYQAQSMGLHARLMSKMCRNIIPLISQTKTLLIAINQEREKVGGYGNPKTTTGGNAIPFFSSGRIEVLGGSKSSHLLDETTGEVIGHRARLKIIKNKFAPPFRECEVNLLYGVGYDHYAEVLDLAIDMGLVQASGSWFFVKEENKIQGKPNFVKLLKEDRDFYLELLTQVCQMLKLDPQVYC